MVDRSAAARSGQVCGTCLFWRVDRVAPQITGWGQCRRMPPAMPPIEEDKLVHVGVWPHTEEREWCGEWRARSEAGPT
jgi:hypothetical protein